MSAGSQLRPPVVWIHSGKIAARGGFLKKSDTWRQRMQQQCNPSPQRILSEADPSQALGPLSSLPGHLLNSGLSRSSPQSEGAASVCGQPCPFPFPAQACPGKPIPEPALSIFSGCHFVVLLPFPSWQCTQLILLPGGLWSLTHTSVSAKPQCPCQPRLSQASEHSP